MRRSSARWLWILFAASVSVCNASTPIPARALSVKGVFATRAGDPTIYCLLGSGSCVTGEDSGAADPFIAHWLNAHRRAVAIPISEEVRASLVRGTVMPREVFVWVEDGHDSLTLSLVQQGFYPAAAIEDMVARDQAFQLTREKVAAETGTPIDQLLFVPPAENRPRRLVSDADYIRRAKLASAAEAEAKRIQIGVWSDHKPLDNDARVAAQMSTQEFAAADLYVSDVHAHRLGDPDIYCLLGGVTCEVGLPVPSLAPGQTQFVQHWLAAHPGARAVPISAANHKRMVKGPLLHSTYIWIDDGRESLNVELVRNGFYRASSLQDMVAYDQDRMAEMGSDPRLATADAELRGERQETGGPVRLVSDDDYAARMARVLAAEREAERRRRGLWSDAQLPLWRPPTDQQLIAKYQSRKSSFARLAALVGRDERLLTINWDPKSGTAAARAGVPQTDIDTYADLLKKLGVNEELTGVAGLGKFCLITTDITYGIFDTGIIKGYVFSPIDPQPLLDDLERRDGFGRDAATAYRRIDTDWYLFELVH